MPPLSYLDAPILVEQPLDSSSSSSHSTFAVSSSSTLKRPLSETTTTLSKPRRRGVSFKKSVEVFRTMHIRDFTMDERDDCWFSRQEYHEIRTHRKETVEVMEDVNLRIDNGQYYFRGLESKTRDQCRRKQWNIVECSVVVLDEQARLQQLHQQQQQHLAASHGVPFNTKKTMPDAEAIARAYMTCAESSRLAAMERGVFDQWAASKSVSTTVVSSPVPLAMCRAT